MPTGTPGPEDNTEPGEAACERETERGWTSERGSEVAEGATTTFNPSRSLRIVLLDRSSGRCRSCSEFSLADLISLINNVAELSQMLLLSAMKTELA